jgi:hypothetical protein
VTPEEHDLLYRIAERLDTLSARMEQVVGMILAVDARLDRLAEAFVRHTHGEAA